jgi:hypothetical protein
MLNHVTLAAFFGLMIMRRKKSLVINSIKQIASFIELFLHAPVIFQIPKFRITKLPIRLPMCCSV